MQVYTDRYNLAKMSPDEYKAWVKKYAEKDDVEGTGEDPNQ